MQFHGAAPQVRCHSKHSTHCAPSQPTWVKKSQGFRWKLSTSTGMTGQSCSRWEGGAWSNLGDSCSLEGWLSTCGCSVCPSVVNPTSNQDVGCCNSSSCCTHLGAHNMCEAQRVPQHAVRAVQVAVRLRNVWW